MELIDDPGTHQYVPAPGPPKRTFGQGVPWWAFLAPVGGLAGLERVRKEERENALLEEKKLSLQLQRDILKGQEANRKIREQYYDAQTKLLQSRLAGLELLEQGLLGTETSGAAGAPPLPQPFGAQRDLAPGLSGQLPSALPPPAPGLHVPPPSTPAPGVLADPPGEQSQVLPDDEDEDTETADTTSPAAGTAVDMADVFAKVPVRVRALAFAAYKSGNASSALKFLEPYLRPSRPAKTPAEALLRAGRSPEEVLDLTRPSGEQVFRSLLNKGMDPAKALAEVGRLRRKPASPAAPSDDLLRLTLAKLAWLAQQDSPEGERARGALEELKTLRSTGVPKEPRVPREPGPGRSGRSGRSRRLPQGAPASDPTTFRGTEYRGTGTSPVEPKLATEADITEALRQYQAAGKPKTREQILELLKKKGYSIEGPQ